MKVDPNDPKVIEQARSAAARVLGEAKPMPERIELAYRYSLSREPNAKELELARDYQQVVGVDLSRAFIDTAETLRRDGTLACWGSPRGGLLRALGRHERSAAGGRLRAGSVP